MIPKTSRAADCAGLLFGAALVATLAGCVVDGTPQTAAVRPRPQVQVQASFGITDDYDYYPGYETYYSRTRHEYVYVENNVWVRRPAPQGVSIDLLFASPSVRMDFRDAPEQHHRSIVQSYPHNWRPPGDRRDDRSPVALVNVNVGRQAAPPPAPVVILDDYDYYPGYETYYSRARHEYVYLENNAWVRRPTPRGVSVAVLLASPAARMDFHDSPENHHGVIARTYPRNWAPEGKGRDDKHDDRDDDKNDDRNNKGKGKGKGNGRNN